MELSLDTDIKLVGPLGRRCGKSLRVLGINNVRDLFWHLPFRYEDFSKIVALEDGPEGEVTVRGRIDMIKTRRSPRKKMLLTEAVISDASGTMKVVWFRQPFITKLLYPGDEIYLSGRIENKPWGLEMVNPAYEKVKSSSPVHTARLVPIYPLSGTLTMKQVRGLLHSVIHLADEMDETLSQDILDKYGLMGLSESLRNIHFPTSKNSAEIADRRLRFEELFYFQMKGAWARKLRGERRARSIPFNEKVAKEFVGKLPFTLTDDQKKVSWEILQDTSSGRAMHRLVEGDVGSGKTVIAAMVMNNAAVSGEGSIMMAPTEILAEQHFKNLCGLFSDTSFSIALKTRSNSIVYSGESTKEFTKKKFEKMVEEDSIDIIVGTHALLSESLNFQNISLVVVDEQHRFGVSQRQKLFSKLGQNNQVPHFLSMTATPIPRSLALALYGDVDFSQLKQMPAGRKPVKTVLIQDKDRDEMYGEIKKEIVLGRKVFIVCPLIEPSDTLGIRSVQEEVDRLKWDAFPDAEIEVLHGKMKPEEKKGVMDRFSSGSLSVLVSTTVVEVGVDIPEATVMVIEGAERFGLAQLHQLRGRVGRSDMPSTCYLASSNGDPQVRERLEGFIKAKDCFELSELDLRLRGPGSIFGEDQSGFAELQRFNPSDVQLINETKEAAEDLLEKDPYLDTHPLLKVLIIPEAEKVHLE